jgi:ribonuclease HI
MITFYSDGSTRGKNQKGANNVGGWGAVCFDETEDDIVLISFDYDTDFNTTNNREELRALLYCLASADDLFPNQKCIIYSDSAYVVNMCNDWIWKWAVNGWKNSKKQTVENLDLVQAIYDHIKKDFYHCIIEKCEGHKDNLGNELADALATGNLKRFTNMIKESGLELSDNDKEWIARRLDEIE